MGWTSYHATYYTNRGKIDRKAECDAYWMEGLNRGHFKVEKSTMVGSVYYAAVRPLLKRCGVDDSGRDKYMPLDEDQQSVFGVIFLTSVDSRDYFNFAYKDMDESMGPYYYDCPKSIIDLLSPTDNEWANTWREKCKLKSDQKAKINALPHGSSIKLIRNDEEWTLTKEKIGKTTRWVDWNKFKYLTVDQIITYEYQVMEG